MLLVYQSVTKNVSIKVGQQDKVIYEVIFTLRLGFEILSVRPLEA